ncbi:I78 family peptidase inhibitor [Pseudoalteromonas sp. McH1-42]|uniref:I78 family peptidase inhibitor n=1 Tax=Pseudoalteromonas sp. McH1-42 TaxID=2917752 RepID=UPI001EF49DF6|nr:I78 family peptidase inhibitor [Pseudoalteromonas sp. McH1-42]MCG7562468.1 hypothetical protein [Pseudoalteromonas sp. McH1-42]
MSNVVNDEPILTLIGKPSRVYTTGDMLTEDFVPNRVNIELSESGEIVRVWMG